MAAPVRLALAGAGRWGRNYIRTIAAVPGARLAALASRNPESARLVPHGCAIHADWRSLVDRRLVDGLIVATPPATHAEIASAAIDAGLPVLIEKPLTLDLAEARELLQRARKAGAIAMCAHTHLFHPAYRALKAQLAEFGAIQEIRAEGSNIGPFRTDTPVLWDWGSHDVAMCLDLLGTLPQRAVARMVDSRPMESAQGETLEIVLDFPGDTGATILISNMLAKRRFLSVRCSDGTLTYDDLATAKLTVQPRGGAVEARPVPDDLPLTIVMQEFCSAVAAGAADVASLELGVKVTEVLAECAASLYPAGVRSAAKLGGLDGDAG